MSKKAASNTTASTSEGTRMSITGGQHGSKVLPISCTPLSEELFTGCDPGVSPFVRAHLDSKQPATMYLLEAWARLGRKDAATGARPYWSGAVRQTVSPLGMACLIAYARAHEDETAARAILAASVAGCCRPAERDESTRRQPVLPGTEACQPTRRHSRPRPRGARKAKRARPRV